MASNKLGSNKEGTCNFSQEETLKFTLLLKDFPVITSKKTDHASNQQKEAAWRSLAAKFNADALVYRQVKQLQQKFNNIKKTARKEMSIEKNGRRQTGGGPPPPKPSETTEWLNSVMGESISGLPAIYDSDALENETVDVHTATTTTSGVVVEFIENVDIDEEQNYAPLDITLCSQFETQDANVSYLNSTDNQETKLNTSTPSVILQKPASKPSENKDAMQFDTSTPYAMLKKPVSKPLEPGKKKRKLTFTPLETRKKIVTMALEKEMYLKKKGSREQKLLQFAEEEHQKNMLHKDELHIIELEFKKKINDLIFKKTALEVEIQEEILKRLKSENKNIIE